MKVIKSKDKIQTLIAGIRNEGLKIGFVPTMGALHEGHISLIQKSVSENDITVASIFVNPIQFNNNNDLQNYPRDEEGDLQKLKSAGCNFVFMPSVHEMYPEEVKEKYDLGGLDSTMEGYFRPGHFQGVAIVVKKLFNIIPAHNAYFGKKDFQQLSIIKHLVKLLKMEINIVGCDTVREDDGLAKSSRNLLLDKEVRKKTSIIPQTLFKCAELKHNLSVYELKKWVESEIDKTDGLKIEYFDVVNETNLQPIKDWAEEFNPVACIAVWAGNVRLIDNISLY